MNHTTHDLELLAALATGYEPDRAAAEALVSSCDECRVVYEGQEQMRLMLAEAGRAQLTENEQSRLLAAIDAARPAPVRPLEVRKPQPKTLSPIWGRAMAVAAAMAVVVGVGATIASQQGSSGATTTVAADTAAAPEFAAGGGSTDERATETTAASAATIYQLAVSEDLDQLKAEAEALADETTAAEGAAVADASCVKETEDLTIEERGESIYQRREVLLLLVEDDDELSPRAFFLDDCTEISLP
ncbi:MAG: hypothetical protein ACRDVK_04185 [Acidimicrobiia bacterium]